MIEFISYEDMSCSDECLQELIESGRVVEHIDREGRILGYFQVMEIYLTVREIERLVFDHPADEQNFKELLESGKARPNYDEDGKLLGYFIDKE
jgi:hypothetical protein